MKMKRGAQGNNLRGGRGCTSPHGHPGHAGTLGLPALLPRRPWAAASRAPTAPGSLPAEAHLICQGAWRDLGGISGSPGHSDSSLCCPFWLEKWLKLSPLTQGPGQGEKAGRHVPLGKPLLVVCGSRLLDLVVETRLTGLEHMGVCAGCRMSAGGQTAQCRKHRIWAR